MRRFSVVGSSDRKVISRMHSDLAVRRAEVLASALALGAAFAVHHMIIASGPPSIDDLARNAGCGASPGIHRAVAMSAVSTLETNRLS
jgi:hypothetical protein